MPLFFDWDPVKAEANRRKHGITFDEAATVFQDFRSGTIIDPLDHENEDRFVTTRQSTQGHLLVVVHADETDTIRIISARPATKRERNDYSEL
ncbi:MAG: BrnT family toxin [Chloroflexota bacterium]|nr:BrnT family toxin [Chloroflexota bacterium]